MGSYRELIAWQKAMDVVTNIYKITKTFPKDELFSLTAQIRRAAVSIASNIAEGHGRVSGADRRHFVAMSRGSLAEVETQLQIAVNLGYVDATSMSRFWNQSANWAKSLMAY